jgi:chloride channel protein, CIC family
MADHEIRGSSTTEGLPVAPSMGPALESVNAPFEQAPVNRRVVVIAAIAIGVGMAAGLIAEALTHLIHLITNLSFYRRFSFEEAIPSAAVLGGWIIAAPVIGALISG